MNGTDPFVEFFSWAGAVALVTSLGSLVFVTIQVRRRLNDLKKKKEQDDARVPAVSQQLKQALADDAGTTEQKVSEQPQKGSEQPKKEVLAPSGQSNSTTVSIDRLKQKRMGAQ